MDTQYDYSQVIHETHKLLCDNPEWNERYKKYAKIILENKDFISAMKSKIYVHELKLYLNTSSAVKAVNQVAFDMRYLGQNVARLVCTPEMLTISTKDYEKRNENSFNCKIELADAPWDSKEASEFRSYFKNHSGFYNDLIKKNDEHRLESLLLTEFSKQKDKALSNIKPVMLGGLRFPMPTPLSAADHSTVKYSGFNGGGIDILARNGIGKNTKLCIMELKDENTKYEPAALVLKQAIKYTVFIRELLRSESKNMWWKLFGFGGEVPEKLVLYAACVMPDIDDRDTSFECKEYDIYGDLIKLHYLYFKEEENKIMRVITSLYGKTRTEEQQEDS